MKKFLHYLLHVALSSVALVSPICAETPKITSFADYEKSATAGAKLPDGLSPPLQALWYSKAGAWDKGHEIAQSIKSNTGSWVHAHFHREEGDLANAGYWYRKAGMTRPEGVEIATEWKEIARELWQRENGVVAGQEVFTSSQGFVAESTEAQKKAERAWDTFLRKNGKLVVHIENARPVSFDPKGKYLLLIDSAADDSCRHFIIDVTQQGFVPAFGKRRSIGAGFISRHEWSEDGTSITFFPSESAESKTPLQITVEEHITPRA